MRGACQVNTPALRNNASSDATGPCLPSLRARASDPDRSRKTGCPIIKRRSRTVPQARSTRPLSHLGGFGCPPSHPGPFRGRPAAPERADRSPLSDAIHRVFQIRASRGGVIRTSSVGERPHVSRCVTIETWAVTICHDLIRHVIRYRPVQRRDCGPRKRECGGCSSPWPSRTRKHPNPRSRCSRGRSSWLGSWRSRDEAPTLSLFEWALEWEREGALAGATR